MTTWQVSTAAYLQEAAWTASGHTVCSCHSCQAGLSLEQAVPFRAFPRVCAKANMQLAPATAWRLLVLPAHCRDPTLPAFDLQGRQLQTEPVMPRDCSLGFPAADTHASCNLPCCCPYGVHMPPVPQHGLLLGRAHLLTLPGCLQGSSMRSGTASRHPPCRSMLRASGHDAAAL